MQTYKQPIKLYKQTNIKPITTHTNQLKALNTVYIPFNIPSFKHVKHIKTNIIKTYKQHINTYSTTYIKPMTTY